MRKVLLGLTFAVAGLGLVSQADGGVKKKPTPVKSRGHDNGNNRHEDHSPRHPEHGIKYPGGYYFSGRYHNHWGHRKWDGGRRCYVYWEPTLLIYYYYDEARDGYYPCD